ncbi:DUF3048 domain-containing protein [Sporosarcina gallistercoris]|uniref:DUF3048 domain-containing protein n=1 Tax=Sporosarcina gallistercoris TaxID=2762245 RepID=A0ABR8PJZ2_9BACL|nr:DUF3048 domain-containing protein [Sporosarcina gallistercoris]MBD7908476.1 DUF3048 domain-containing protein [Sporosarcina gallistercoris]
MNVSKVLFTAVLAGQILLVGCSKDKEELSEPEVEAGETVETVAQPSETMAPFSGTAVESADHRPILATVNNHPLARPQSGLSQADVVYEVFAEGNITRLLALYQSQLPDEIGPIRSARDYFVEIAEGLDAFYIAHGYSPDAHALLNAGVVDNINGMQYDGTYFVRSKERKAPHNSYISKEHIEEAMEDLSIDDEIREIPSLSFHPDADSAKLGEIASTIVVGHPDPNFMSTYTFDKESKTYERSVNGIITTDKAADKKVTPANILVMEAPYATIDAEGRQSLDLTNGGSAILFQNGVALPLEWKQIDGVITPVQDGVPAKLVPGQTWVHIVHEQAIGTTTTYTP